MNQDNKLQLAREAAKGLVDVIAGGSSSSSIAPSTMAITSFHDSVASVEQTLTTDADALRGTLNSFAVGSGHTNIGEGVWRGETQLAVSSGSNADYIVLLSDGGANRPAIIPAAPAPPDQTYHIYLDVNDDGVLNADDDLSVDYPDADSTPDFVVVDGLLNDGAICQILDVNGGNPCFTGADDDYDFSAAVAPSVTPNFRIRDAHL